MMHITAKSITAKLAAMVAIAAMLALSTVVSLSDSTLARPVSQWFEALRTGDDAIFSSLLHDEATIELKDLGIVQTKNEFIESLDQWSDLNKGVEILLRQVASNDDGVVIEVCYRFSSNEVFNRETFALSGDTITGSVQEKISDRCEGF